MGSKNLRAIVLCPSRTTVDVPGGEKIKETARSVSRAVKENPLSKALNDLGTAGGIVPVNSSGSLPTHNWTRSMFDKAEALGGDLLRDKYMKKRHGCFACPVRCKRIVEINQDNLTVDPDFGGPEYESIATLGSMCDIGDLAVVCKANELCNRFGLDTMSCGSTIAFAMQCFEEGLISEKDVGYDLSFGNGKSHLRMIEDIAYRRGFGDILALVSYRAAKEIGGKAAEFVHHVKKQELPMHDGRIKTGLAFQYALSPRGADHWIAQHDPFFAAADSPGIREMSGIGIGTPVPKTDHGPEKVRFFYITNNLCSSYDMLGVCALAAVARSVVTLDQILELARAATNWNLTWYEIMKAGERANNMARLFNIRAGVGAEMDQLPAVFTENMRGGPNDGSGAIDGSAFAAAVETYYEMAGWDSVGKPRESKLAELELHDFL
jgi:aldehyde:ferredoxin oxidoreductase